MLAERIEINGTKCTVYPHANDIFMTASGIEGATGVYSTSIRKAAKKLDSGKVFTVVGDNGRQAQAFSLSALPRALTHQKTITTIQRFAETAIDTYTSVGVLPPEDETATRQQAPVDKSEPDDESGDKTATLGRYISRLIDENKELRRRVEAIEANGSTAILREAIIDLQHRVSSIDDTCQTVGGLEEKVKRLARQQGGYGEKSLSGKIDSLYQTLTRLEIKFQNMQQQMEKLKDNQPDIRGALVALKLIGG